MVSVFARTRSGTALLFLNCTGLAKSVHPRDEQSVPEGPGWESIATNVTKIVTFRDSLSRSIANHLQPAFAKSTGLFHVCSCCAVWVTALVI